MSKTKSEELKNIERLDLLCSVVEVILKNKKQVPKETLVAFVSAATKVINDYYGVKIC